MCEEEREDKEVYEFPEVGRALQGTGTDSTGTPAPRPRASRGSRGAAATNGRGRSRPRPAPLAKGPRGAGRAVLL